MIDASIPLRAQTPQFQDPTNALAKVLSIRGAMQGQQADQLRMDEYRRGVQEQETMRTALAGGADSNRLRQLGFLKQANDWDKQAAETDHKRGETVDQRLKQWAATARNVRTPEQAAGYINAQYDDPIIGPIIAKIEPREKALAGLPKDPATVPDWAMQAEVGIGKFAEHQRALAQQAETGRHNRAGEDNTRAGHAVTMRGQNMVDGRAREGLQVQREAARTEVKETADGWVAIDKGTKQVTPLVGADGKPLSPKLKDAPPAVQAAVLGNAQNLGRAQRALTLLEGLDIGDPAKGGQQGDKNATGLKGYLPNQLLNRMDPKGVDARAAIADLGSLVIHDRSGAAVTAAEFPRLAPFIPTEKDDADAAKKKLRRFVQVYREELAASEAAYNPATGFKPPGGARPAAGGGGATVSNW